MNGTVNEDAQTERLLESARAGDRLAFEQLFALHRPYLRRVIDLRLGPRLRARVDPSDVVQEAQLESFRRLADYCARRPMGFRLWLRKTAQERLTMLRRSHLGAGKRSVEREVRLADDSSLQLAGHLLAPGPSPSQHLAGRERARKVREAVAELGAADREILILRNLEELSNAAAAAVLEIDPATASRRYGRALLRLREILIARGLTGSQP